MTSDNPSAISRPTDENINNRPLWQYVPVNDYKVPVTTIQRTFKTRFMAFRERLHTGTLPPAEQFHKANDLKSLPDRLLKQILPATDWHAHMQAIDDSIAAWCEDEKKFGPAIFLMNIPYSHTENLLAGWAESKGLSIIDPPDPADISAGGDIWLKQLAETDGIWILPHLEKCYLRHASGLALMRRLFARLFSRRLGRGVIGCNSWAWAYLSRTFRLASQSLRVPQAFDSETLSHWFYGSLPENKRHRFIFRQADTGRYVIKPASGPNTDARTSAEPSLFLKDLAAYSRGIPGVALALWQRCLKGQPDTIQAQKEENTGSPLLIPIWVQSIDSMEKPSLPQKTDRGHTFVLHNLLLHNGLTDDLLAAVLPLSPEEIQQACFELERGGAIESNDGIWRVSPAGYPVVREFLKTEGFLTDDF